MEGYTKVVGVGAYVFTFELVVSPEDLGDVDLDSILDTMNYTGSASLVSKYPIAESYHEAVDIMRNRSGVGA